MKRFIILPVRSLLASILMICAILCPTDMMANNDLRKEVNGTTYRLYREVVNRNDVRVNGDGTSYYRTRLMLEVNKGGSKSSYEMGSNLYMTDEKDVHMCMLIDFKARKVLAFAISKSTDRSYGMDGFAFVSSLDNISFIQETVFTSSNWGFFPYFVETYSQNYTLSHFSFAGYRQMRSIRSTDGKWSSNNVGSKSPSVADAEWRGKDKILVIGAYTNADAAGSNLSDTSDSNNNSDYNYSFALPEGNSLEAKLFREALQRGRKYRERYILINESNKQLKINDVLNFCRRYGYRWKEEYESKEVARFGDVASSVYKFEFMPLSVFAHYVFDWTDRTGSNSSQLKSKGTVYFYEAESNRFICLKNALWTGGLKDGFIDGTGAGICRKDDLFYYYYSGTFKRGFPLGTVKYRLVETDDSKAWGYSPREKTPNGSNGNGAPFRDVEVGEMCEGLAAFRYLDNGGVNAGSPSKLYGYINQNGSVIITPTYTSALPFNNGRAVVKNERGEELYIDKSGRMLDYTDNQKKLTAIEKARQDSIQAAENRKKLLAEQKAAEEKRAAEAKEAALKRRIEANKNTKLWSKGCRLAYRFPNGTEYVIATLEEWNENRSRVKVKIVASPSATREIKGERLEKNNTLWVSAHNEGWHLALDEEIDIALRNDNSVKQDTPQTIYVDPSKNNCKTCHGRGVQICPQCNGTGRTHSGERQCNLCYGKGSYRCYDCWGSGKR